MINFKNMFNFNKRGLGEINGKEDKFYIKKSLVRAYILSLLSILILLSLFKLSTFSISYLQNNWSQKALSTLKNTPAIQAPASPNKSIKWSIKVPASAIMAGKHLVEIPKGAEEVKITALNATSTKLTKENTSLLNTNKDKLTKADRLKLSKIAEENAKSQASEKLKETLKQEELNKIQNNSALRKPRGFFSNIWNKLTSITAKMTATAENAIAPIQDALASTPAPEVTVVDIAPVVVSSTNNTPPTPDSSVVPAPVSSSGNANPSVIPDPIGNPPTEPSMDSRLRENDNTAENDNTGAQTDTNTNTNLDQEYFSAEKFPDHDSARQPPSLRSETLLSSPRIREDDTINGSSSTSPSVIPAPVSTSGNADPSVIPDSVRNPVSHSDLSSDTKNASGTKSGSNSETNTNLDPRDYTRMTDGETATPPTSTTTPPTPDILIEYQTPAPTIAEANTDTGKIVTISDNLDEDSETHTTNVLAFTNIPEIYKVGQEKKIKIKWLNNNGEEMPFNTYDLDLDGKLDYVEWTVPHLSTQTFEIIFITKALELDENNEVTGDIYDLVKEQDNTWAPIPNSHTVRATFAKFLTKKNDITLFAKVSQTDADGTQTTQTDADNTQTNADGNPPSVLPSDPSVIPAPAFASINSGGIQSENSGLGHLGVPEDDNAGATTYSSVDVYPVYEGIRSEQKIATFENITNAKIYKILLTNLPKSTNTFDLKVSGSIDIDYIVDPTPITVTDTFLNSSMIASMTNITIDTTNGLLSLSPASSWSCGSTLIDGRDAKTYATVLIGAQCWMQQNLNVGTMVTGVTTQGTSSVSIQKYCYNNLESGCTSGGGLYQWDQAMTGTTTAGTKGICPTGWHIPTHDEFTTLERATCLSNGTATTTCYTNFPYDTITTGWRGTNEGTTMKNMSGLWKGILTGYRSTAGSFNDSGTNTYFWSSIPSSGSAWKRLLYSGFTGDRRDLSGKADGSSVRCLKD